MKIRDIEHEDDYSHDDEQTNGKDNHERAGDRVQEARRPDPRPPEARRPAGSRGAASRPAETFARGNVRVSIWANPTPWGEVEWKVSFNRVYSRTSGNGYSRSFDLKDLLDLIQGAFDARRWIAKTEKRLRGPRWFIGWT